MRVLLLQDEIYLPSFGGGTKANRYLLESLARRGHECLAVTRALTQSQDGPRTRERFLTEMASRGAVVERLRQDVFGYRHAGVSIQCGDWASAERARQHVTEQVREFCPDWILVADDKRRYMLEAAVQATPNRVVPIVQTIIHLPFGPLAVNPSWRQTQLMADSRSVVVISRFLEHYVREHSSLDCRLVRLPVYGDGPFPCLARFDAGFVMMINPCPLKGLSIFMALAQQFPHLPFAAVPTWGADGETLARLAATPNVTLLNPSDDIAEILAHARILLVPSLWPETFGYVVPEAMLRGIPVLASNVGGLPEAKLGVDYVLPVSPMTPGTDSDPVQDTMPWANALEELVADAGAYLRCSQRSRAAAQQFVSQVSASPFDTFLAELISPTGPTTPD